MVLKLDFLACFVTFQPIENLLLLTLFPDGLLLLLLEKFHLLLLLCEYNILTRRHGTAHRRTWQAR
jgi:hypothetical protein